MKGVKEEIAASLRKSFEKEKKLDVGRRPHRTRWSGMPGQLTAGSAAGSTFTLCGTNMVKEGKSGRM